MISATKRRALAALAALCLFFSVAEQAVPRPLPFFRLGLSNIPLVLALDFMSLPELLLLGAIKTLAQGLVGGGIFSYVFAFSALGCLASLFTMSLAHRIPSRLIGPAGISTLGALASNLAQGLLSYFFIFGPDSLLILPITLSVGSLSGFVMGIFCAGFGSRSRWMAQLRAKWRSEP